MSAHTSLKTFSQLARYFESLEKTASRVEMTKILADLFSQLGADDIGNVLYLLQGRVAPLYEKVEFGLAEKMILRSVIKALDMDGEKVGDALKKSGDIGITVEDFKRKSSTPSKTSLTIHEVFELLTKITASSGTGSQEQKLTQLAHVVRQLDPLSARYVVRIPTNTLRLGFSDMTILDAFSWMISGDKSLRPQIESAYHVRPDLGFIGTTIKQKGIAGLSGVVPRLFTPIIMMRAERLSSGEEIIAKIGPAPIEPKYDGFRLQAHISRSRNEVRLYSRNLEDVSFMYPDVIAGIQREIIADEAIIEGEAIGFEPHSATFLPFQETVQRKRKYDIEAVAKKIPLKFFAFELLYANGKSFITTAYTDRRAKLESIIKVSGNIHEDTLLISPEEIAEDAESIERMFDDAIAKGLEGIIAKKSTGIYQPGARGWNWIKFKRSYSSKIEDTIDCVVMGYDYGKGKRSDFGIGAFLVGVYDAKQDMFKTVAKIGTGLTDDEWRAIKKNSDRLKSAEKPAIYDVDKLMSVDVWVKPSLVVEIKADEITRSPVHTAGRTLKKTKSEKAMEVDMAGFALRFPRLEKFREDKRPEDATTVSEVEKMYSHK